MSVGLESLPLAETTPDSHLVNPNASDNTEDMGLIIMLCLTIGIIFGLIGLTIRMTKNRMVRYTILAKMMSIFNDLERMSFKKETHNVEDNDVENNTPLDVSIEAINAAPDTPRVTTRSQSICIDKD